MICSVHTTLYSYTQPTHGKVCTFKKYTYELLFPAYITEALVDEDKEVKMKALTASPCSALFCLLLFLLFTLTAWPKLSLHSLHSPLHYLQAAFIKLFVVAGGVGGPFGSWHVSDPKLNGLST